jgi:hypothetical protein
MLKNRLFQNGLTQRMADFLNEIGIKVLSCKIDYETFLPGIAVKDGSFLVNEEKLLFPGDLLHEAGHLAVTPAHLRKLQSDEIELDDFQPDILEVEAIAWSYAACVHLGIEPEIVFHKDGYKGNSEALLLNFSLGIFFGVNQLEDAGLTLTQQTAQKLGKESYPKMLKWCKD